MRRSVWCVLGMHRWHYQRSDFAKGSYWKRCTRMGCHENRFIIESWKEEK